MGLLDTEYSTVNTKKPRNSDRIQPVQEMNLRGLLDAATNIPVAGDALSGGMALYDAAKGDYGSAAMNALGILPFVSAGMIKGTGKIADALNANHSLIDGYVSEGDKAINLSKIVVPKELRNKGAGTKFMNDLVAEADKAGKTVTLTPASDFGGSKARLTEFYKRFGFVPNKGKTADYEISDAMYRNPQPVTVNAEKGSIIDEYAGLHRPPMKDNGGAPLHDLTGGGSVYPDDIYSPQASQYYGHFGGNDPMDVATMRMIKSYRNNPDAPVTMYRAIPSDLPKDTPISNGDWVTINKNYAMDHGNGALGGDFQVIQKQVPARKLFTNGDSIHEYGYDESGRINPMLLGSMASGGLLGLGGYSLMSEK